MRLLKDGLGRQLRYLRLSITDRCNFRCVYCLPDGCPRGCAAEPLSVLEIERLVRAFAALGVRKVRLTGGEPTLRRDVVDIVRVIATTPGVSRVGLTTNGYRLAAIAGDLRRAGLTSLNVSLDSLDAERFERITGHPGPAHIVEGLEAAVAAGVDVVKVNVVLLRGMDDRELDQFLDWTVSRPVTVRFIELMQTGENTRFFGEHHVAAQEIRSKLEQRGWTPVEKDADDGPARTWRHAGHEGRAGVIAPYTPGFCDSCNRVRVSSVGDLQLCLFGESGIPLRAYLESDAQQRELMYFVESAMLDKPASHFLRDGVFGSTTSLAVIGG
jgi:cyclic pyranopterin phosphate synthase